MNKEKKFDKEASIALKGVAVLLMLFLHCFFDKTVNDTYGVTTSPLPYLWVLHLSWMGKISVAMFAFISGYGLFQSYRKHNDIPEKWIGKRVMKIYSTYSFVWILAAIVSQIIDGRFVTEFFEENDFWLGITECVADFFGVSNLLDTATLNSTWWYLSAALVFIVITPLAVKNESYLTIHLILSIFFLRIIFGTNGENVFAGSMSVASFLPAYFAGTLCAKYDLINRIINADHRWIRFGAELVLLWLAYQLYSELSAKYFWEVKYLYIPMVVILFSVEYIFSVSVFKKVLVYFGKRSNLIFLTHTFIRKYYLMDYTYSFKHFVPIYLILIFNSLILTYLVEGLMHITGYNKLMKRLIKNA